MVPHPPPHLRPSSAPRSNHLGTKPQRSDGHNVPRRIARWHAASRSPAASDTLLRSASRSAPRMIVSPHFRIGRSVQLVYGGETSTLAASRTSEVTLVGTAPRKDGIDRGSQPQSIVSFNQRTPVPGPRRQTKAQDACSGPLRTSNAFVLRNIAHPSARSCSTRLSSY